MQNTNPSGTQNQSSEGRFRSRAQHEAIPRDGADQAVKQGRTEVVRRRDVQNPPPGRRKAPDQDLVPTRPQAASDRGEKPVRSDSASRQSGKPREQRQSPSSDGNPTRRDPAGNRQDPEKSRPLRQPKTREERPDPERKDADVKEKDRDGRKFYFQRLKDISTLRKMLILVFGLLFLWCAAPAFFHIMGIGVISSSVVMLAICLTALFWHLIDRNWTLKKAALVSLAGILFAACVVAFSVVSGLMLKASLTAVPSDCGNYTIVVLGCKAEGDQPSWMLSDRLAKAYSLLNADPDLKCVVTGGKGDDEQYTEAYVMKKYLVDRGIPAERIYMEELSGNTEENLLYTKSLIELSGLSDNIVIVTDRFHELRARIWAEKSGFRNIYSGCCETRIYLVTGYWFREMFGLARLYFFGV